MSTLLIAAALIAAIAGIFLLLISINKQQKRHAMNIFLNRLSQAGTSNNLSFSSQELLNNSAIGLDGLRRQLLVLTRFGNGDYFNFTIDLDKVQCCSVKKVYGFINAGELKNSKLERHLEEIILHIVLYQSDSVDIPFYSHIENHIEQANDLEHKAKQWEIMLTKLLNERFKKAGSEKSATQPGIS